MRHDSDGPMTPPARAPKTGAEPRPDKTPNPDAELTRSFAVGCGVLILAFLLLSLILYFVWTR